MEPRPRRVSLAVNTGHSSSVTAAGTVPRRRPPTTTPSMRRPGLFRTCHHERRNKATPVNIQAPKIGAKYAYVGATWALGPKAFADTPSMIRYVIVIRYAHATNGAYTAAKNQGGDHGRLEGYVSARW